MAINPALILKHIISDCEQERHTAADKLYAANQRKEFHPDDWTRGKGARVAKIGSLNEDVLRKAEQRAKHAEASAEIEREAREKAEAEIEKLKEQLAKEKRQACWRRQGRIAQRPAAQRDRTRSAPRGARQDRTRWRTSATLASTMSWRRSTSFWVS